ncbi:ABC transporter permease [Novosphingobium lentum]|uniref:ABC transporter permease n=1 Tax=Novosphingobium lentum TaxID=145287 RepID=UPI00082B02C1|nr:ABC transporter permease [Novosphingobium lentum]
MMPALVGVARLELLRLIRSPMALSLLLVVPAFQVVLFGYAIRPGEHAITVAIAAPGREEADRFAERLSRELGIQVVERDVAPRSAAAAVRLGRALAGIDLPIVRSPDHPDAPTLPLRVTVDGSNAPLAHSAIDRIEKIYWRERAQRDRFADLRMGLAIERINNPLLRDSWTFLPSLSGVVVMIAALMLGCLGVAREREGGTWETLRTMPIGSLELVLGKLAPGTVIGTVQGLAVIGLARGLFGVPLPANAVWLGLVVLPLFAAVHLAIGLAISMRARTQLAALQGAVAFYLPAMLLSGFLYPVETMPRWAQLLGNVFPLTHYVRAARLALVQGGRAEAVLATAAPIAGLLVVAIALAVLGRRVAVDD